MYSNKGAWNRAIECYEKDIEIKAALGDRHGVGITLSNIGKLYLDRSNPVSAKGVLEEAIKKIHPDARPHYPNALNWFAVSLHMIANQKKREAKLASSDIGRKKLVSDAAKLYREAAERYKETYRLPLARMPRSLMMDAHLTRGLSYSAQNITEGDVVKAIELLDSAIAEMKAALEFADGADTIRLKGAIASHEVKRCVREIDLHKKDAEKRDRLLDRAIDYLGEASESFGSLGETDACSSKTCDGCRHLYTALGLIRDDHRKRSNQKFTDAIYEIRSAKKCYQSISNELGTDVADQVTKLLKRVEKNLKSLGASNREGAVDATNDVFDALDEIAGVGLRNMIKILVWDEAGNVTERKISERSTTGSEQNITVVGDRNVIQTAGQDIEQRSESLPEKRKTVSLWDYVLGAIGAIVIGVITAISMSLYFEEPIKNFRIPAGIICVIMLLIIIYMRYRISNSKT